MTRGVLKLLSIPVILMGLVGGADVLSGMAAQSPVYVVGAIVALTGPTSITDYGVNIRRATELASQAINAAAGAGGTRISMLYQDSQSSPSVAAAAMRGLVHRVPMVLVGDADVLKSIAPLAEANRVLVINCCASASPPLDAHSYVYSARPYESEEEILMRYLRQQGHRRVAMIHNGTGPALRSQSILEEVLPRLGMQLVHVVVCRQGIADYRGYIAEVMGTAADVLYLNTSPDDAAEILVQAEAARMPMPIASPGSALDPQIPLIATRAAEGFLIGSSVAWDPSTHPRQRAFVARYLARFGDTPTGVAALAYDATRHILPALIQYTQSRHLPYTGESLKQALDSIGTFSGELTGACRFIADHQCLKDMAVVTVRDGKFRILEIAHPHN